MSLSVVLVHYHTPQLLRLAHRALQPSLHRLGAECLVVDNGSDEAARGTLESLPVRLLEGVGNRGYAAGVNLGVEETEGALVVVMNPDVLVQPGCLEELCAELERGSHIAGPRFYWDEELRLMAPPAEPRTAGYELFSALATGGEGWARRARRRWRRHARRYRVAREPLASFDLSGALLAFRRDAWAQIGPFDESYRLYFEETDWLQRARRAGLRGRYLPAATAVHLYDQSARREAAREEWYGDSARRFRRRHYGHLTARLIERLEQPAREGVPLPAASLPLSLPPEACCVELSARREGFPAVVEELSDHSTWRPPSGLARFHPGLELFVRWIDRRGRELSAPRRIELS